jgi:hypothetical protein
MNFLWMTPAEKGAWVMKRVIETLKLFQEFGIDPKSEDAWMRLAIALAERYKPGLGLPRKRGRRREHANDDIHLMLMVELLKHRDDVSVREACEVIAQTGAIKEISSKTLQERHKRLMRNGHWKTLIKGLQTIAQGEERYIECLEAGAGDLLRFGTNKI